MTTDPKTRALLLYGVNLLLAAGLGYWLLGLWGIAAGLAVYVVLLGAYMAFKKARPKLQSRPGPAAKTAGDNAESGTVTQLFFGPLALLGVVMMALFSLSVGAASMVATPLLERVPAMPAIRPRLQKALADWKEPSTLGWLALNVILLLLLLTLWIGVEVILLLGLIATPVCLTLIAVMAARGRDPY